MRGKIEQALWLRFRPGGSACSKINSKSKEKTAKFRNISDNGYLDWLFHQNVFPLRELNSILSGKGKGLIFEELFRSLLNLNLTTRKILR